MAIALDTFAQADLPSTETGRRRGRKQPLPPLFDGQHIICPRCRKSANILDFTILPEMPVYQEETVPVIRCSCSYLFALRPTPQGLPPRRMA